MERGLGICFLIVVIATPALPKCLTERPAVQYKRHLFYDGKSIPITLETSMRTSHNIANHILKILLEEVIGYEKVEIRNEDSMNATAIMNRISGCPSNRCDEATERGLPETMVNLEVWMMAGFSRIPWTNTGDIIDMGPLGPFGRLGWFMPSSTVDKLWDSHIIADHWRALFLPAVIRNFSLAEQVEQIKNLTLTGDAMKKHFCMDGGCRDGIFYGPSCSPTNMYKCATLLASYPDMDLGVLKSQVMNLNLPINIAWIGPHLKAFVESRNEQHQPVLFFSWQPNSLTSSSLYTRIKFPLCEDDHIHQPSDCDFGLNQFTKVVWSQVKTSIPEAYHVISKMNFHQDQYTGLLQKYLDSLSTYDTACSWMTDNEDIWTKWLPQNLSNKTKIYLGGLFPMTGLYWMEPGLVQGAELALDHVNSDPSILPEHSLEVIVSNSECLPDVSMKAFIKYISNNTVPIAGILGPGCSDEAEPIAALSRHFNMLVVSYGAEASSLSDQQKYPYFYRTIPQVDHHRFVYEKFFKAMEWGQIGAIAEGGQEFPEYHLLLQDHLQQQGISVVVKHKIVRNTNNLDVSQIFADLRAQNVRVIIADFFVFAARAVMCEAWRQRMTAHEGYVWFLPAWYTNYWWDVDYYNSPASPGDDRPQEAVPCTTANMEYAVDGHFILQKTFSDPDETEVIGGITIADYKQAYTKRVGMADVDGTPFASYVYDAVWVYALGLDRVLKRHPGALQNLHSKKHTDAFVDEINKLDFQGVSGRIHFSGGDRPGTISVIQYFLNETRLVGRYTPAPKNTEGKLELYPSRLRWLTPGGVKPTDGHPEKEDCLLESFQRLFNVSCEMAIVLANVIAFVLLLLIIVIILVLIKYRYDKKVRATHQRMKELGLLTNDLAHCFSFDEWEVPREKVVLNRKLGEGAFGTVFGGEAQLDNDGTWTAVAVKTLKVGSSVQEKVDFLSEAELMKRFSHPNIVQLLGVCTRGEPVYAIMEFLLYGDLKTFLLSRRSLVGQVAREAEDVSPRKLTQMAVDVAHGLRYLHQLRYVHRDLACRNCLVHSNQTVKIGDFGMTRPTSDTDYYRFNKRGMLPVRWMAPESLSDGLFTAKSDIWSYGILIYEIVTFGSFPYQGFSNSQVLEYVKSGSRLTLPRNCPDDVCDFVYSCLDNNLNERPDLEDIIDDLMKNPEFLKPCLDAPTTSIVIEDSDALEQQHTVASCQNTITQSHSTKFTAVLNRRSFYGSSSQEKLNSIKRLSGTPGLKHSPGKNTSGNCRTFLPGVVTRPRSNSVGTPEDCHKDKYSAYTDITKALLPQLCDSDKNNRHSEEIPNRSCYNQYVPLLTTNCQLNGPLSSDYNSDTSKELCQTVTSV